MFKNKEKDIGVFYTKFITPDPGYPPPIGGSQLGVTAGA